MMNASLAMRITSHEFRTIRNVIGALIFVSEFNVSHVVRPETITK